VAGLGQNDPVDSNTAEGLVEGLGGALQAGGEWPHRLEVPGPLCLLCGHRQPALDHAEERPGNLSLPSDDGWLTPPDHAW
jgi:hypothetical protein